MNDHLDAKGKAKRAVTGLAGATVSEVLGNALTSGTPSATPAPAAHEAPPDSAGHEWVPEVETHTVTRGEDGSVEAKTGTVWHPESHGDAGTLPVEDLPTIEEFEQIEVREDEFGNFVIDATERFVVHNHGHDETYVEHQHVVVPGDGTPGDTDIDIVEHAGVVVHENPDGTISVEHHGSLSYELHPDAPGHGDVEVWQEESVSLDEAPAGPPGIEVGISEDEQVRVDDPFGEPAGPTIHQSESVGDKVRTGTVTSTVTGPSPALPGPAPAPTLTTVTFSRSPSTVDTVAAPPVATPLAAEAGRLAATSSLTEHPAVRHPDPKPSFATEHPAEKHSFVTEPDAGKHHPGEVTGSQPVHEDHPFEPPKPVDDGTSPPEQLPAHGQEPPTGVEPEHTAPGLPRDDRFGPDGRHEPFDHLDRHGQHDLHGSLDEPRLTEPHPEPAQQVPDTADHGLFHQANADGGG